MDDDYLKFLEALTESLHHHLNPDPKVTFVGFACFVYPMADQSKLVSLISNTEHELFFPVLKKYVDQMISEGLDKPGRVN